MGLPAGDLLSTLRVAVRSQGGGGLPESAPKPGLRPLSQTAPGNSYASVDEDGWCLSVDTPEKPGKEADEKLDRLKSWLGRHMRTTRLTDMLIEVDNDIRFTDHFLPRAQKGKRDRKEICTILAAVLGHGCNLGLGTMADLIQGISYKQLRRVSDWQMTQEAQRAALAAVVHEASRPFDQNTGGFQLGAERERQFLNSFNHCAFQSAATYVMRPRGA